MLITWDANLYLEVLNFDTFLTVPYELKSPSLNILTWKLTIFNEKWWIFDLKLLNWPDFRNIWNQKWPFSMKNDENIWKSGSFCLNFKSDNFERQIKIILSNLNIEISESEKMSFYEVSDFTKENTFTDLAEGPAVDKVNISKIAILTQKLTITWSKWP